MGKEIEVTFPGNVQVEAQVDGFVVKTDQPVKSGGEGSAPTPFDLFGCSLATCAGYFAMKFCKSRKIDTEGMKLKMKYEWDADQKRFPKMVIDLQLPAGFPEKYNKAIQRAMDQCAVKQHVINPPEFEITLS